MASAVEVLCENGIEAVSHRGVASRADASLASTTYYFADLSELVLAAVEELTRRELAAAQEQSAGVTPRSTVDEVVDVLLGTLLGAEESDPDVDQHRIMLRYERLAGTGRRAYLAPVMSAAVRDLLVIMSDTFTRAARPQTRKEIEALIVTIDGLTFNSLVLTRPSPRHDARRALRSMLR